MIWTFASSSSHNNNNNTSTSQEVMLNTELERGGIMIASWREGEGELVSQLEMVGISPRDIGNYSCSLPGDLAALASATLRLHIVTELQEPVINGAAGSCLLTEMVAIPTLWGWMVLALSLVQVPFPHCD